MSGKNSKWTPAADAEAKERRGKAEMGPEAKSARLPKTFVLSFKAC